MTQHKALAQKTLEELRKRLLDKTSRNKLLKFNVSNKAGLRIIDELPDQLAELLLSDQKLSFRPVPIPTREQLIKNGYLEIDEESGEEVVLKDHPSAQEWAGILGLNTSYELPKKSDGDNPGKHDDDQIQTLLYTNELEARLKKLLQTSNLAIQEMGTNILYLAFGFLEWYEYQDTKQRLAPLFLIPIRLEKGNLNKKTGVYEYSIRYSGEEIVPNISLREKLREDFGLSLPDLDDKTPPEKYFKEVMQGVRSNPSWGVRRYASLALLNFSKMLMYLDLDPENWPKGKGILEHPLILQFLTGYSGDEEEAQEDYSDYGFGEEYEIDGLKDVHSKYPIIDDADSSQHSALVDAVNGKNLVIEGPPGTGKSQTITNLIAALIAQGKKVLFVAEKLAALEVVKRRLDHANLGDFCLELHSHKSQKQKVLEDLGQRLKKHGHYKSPGNLSVCIDGFEKQKKKLNQHANLINKEWKLTEKTPSEIFMGAVRFRNETTFDVSLLHLEKHNGDSLTPAFLREMVDLVQTYKKVYQSVVDRLPDDTKTITTHPWFGVQNRSIQLIDRDKILSALGRWQQSLNDLEESGEDAAETLQIASSEMFSSIQDLQKLSLQINSLPETTGRENFPSLVKLTGVDLKRAKDYLVLYLDLKAKVVDLSSKLNSEILEDLSEAQHWVSLIEELHKSVIDDISVVSLEAGLRDLQKAKDALEHQNKAREHFASQYQGGDQEVLAETLDGFKNFLMMLQSVAAFDPTLTRMQDSRFDNEELDELLPVLDQVTADLRSQRADLEYYFDLSQVPDHSIVRTHFVSLKNAGAFKVFSSDWRKTRKSVKRYLRNSKEQASKVTQVLPRLVDYLRELEELKKEEKYERALGEFFKSIDTDLDQLIAIRDWYRQVRKKFGIGVGPTVELGAFILSMPEELVRTARALTEQDVSGKLNAALSTIKDLGAVFSAIKTLEERSVSALNGPGSIQEVLDTTESRLSKLRPLFYDLSTPISFYRTLAQDLLEYQTSSEEWNRSVVDKELFDGILKLSLDHYEDDAASLEVLTTTLGLAEAIDAISSSSLSAAINLSPEHSFFQRLSRMGREVGKRVDQVGETEEQFAQIVDLDRNVWSGRSLREQPLEIIMSRNQRALSDVEALSTWLEYLRCRADLNDQGLETLVDHIETEALSINEIEDAHQAGIFDQLSREIFSEEKQLREFSGIRQEALQEKLAEYDQELKTLQQQEVASRSAKVQIPRGSSSGKVSEYTERSLIDHEVTKKKRHIPIRQLMNRAGSAVFAMKSCYMMSPMSVAQYLEPGQVEFDVLIMDEASQIKPEDALGAIARAKQMVVVGDPNQLPPTSFFDRINDADEEDITGAEESESILDATLPMFKKRRLRWHYRSQHESLIAFSNHFFYNDDLVVFPSPHSDTSEFGIQRTFISDGVFANRRNMAEARTVSEAVRAHLLSHEDESIGVVAMNTKQREHIEAAIEMLSKDDERFRNRLERDAASLEPLFVKNLENVQGDERDVILVSITYGPQESGGRVAQRFGPINSDVGWRRLNVLFTRSKKRMHIFTSMTSDDIVVGPGAKRGVTALRDFLGFCETGILAKTNLFSDREPDSDFEIAVINLLSRRGYECVPQVGVAGYFIDIAVRDPNNPGRFLMGIECDGASYHSAKSARDRDRLRQTILERLGWRIRRIWSTDWFNHPDAELQPILDELGRLAAEPTRDSKHVSVHDKSSVVIQEKSHAEEKGTVVPVKEIIENEVGIREGLEWLAKEIEKECPETPSDKRLLRTAMIEAITQYEPLDKTEFLQVIPEYLREKIAPEEGRFLSNVFDVVNGSLAIEETTADPTYENLEKENFIPAQNDLPPNATDYSVDQDSEHQQGEEKLSSSVMRDLQKARTARNAAWENIVDEPLIGSSVDEIAVKLKLHRLRERIWEETGTEPDKYGILRRNLVRKYLQTPFASLTEWEAMVGSEAEKIHESHKPYIPKIIEILSKLEIS
jgi:very-short-patch-repair endonuclease